MLGHQSNNFYSNLLYLIFEVVNFASYCGTSEKGITWCWRKEGHFIGWRTSWPQTFQPQASTLDLSTSDFSTINVSIPDFSTMNFSSPQFKTSWLKILWLKSLGLKGQGLKSPGLRCFWTNSSTFMQFWRSNHMNKLNWLTPQDI